MNRRIRTRTYGGVGAGAGDRPGYPITTNEHEYTRMLPRMSQAVSELRYRVVAVDSPQRITKK